MSVRAVRGATQLETDTRDHMLDRVAEMVRDVMEANELASTTSSASSSRRPPTCTPSSRRTPPASSASTTCR